MTLIEVEILLDAARSFNQKPQQPVIQQPTAPSRPAVSPAVVAPVLPTDMTEVERRAIAYTNAMPEAIQGQNGSAALLRVCNKLYEFGLDRDTAKRIIMEHYNPRCTPEWSEKEIDHKLDTAYNKPLNEAGSMLETVEITDSMRTEVEELKQYMRDKKSSKKDSIARVQSVTSDTVATRHQVEQRKQSNTGKPSEENRSVIVPRLIDLSTIEVKPIEWLWINKFHYGGLTILTGLPKQGKSMFTAYMATVISHGRSWCDNTPCERGSILFFAGEDSPEEYKRRLDANGADITKIRILDGATLLSEGSREEEEIDITLARLDVLEAAIDQTEKVTDLPVRMIVIDPISNFWGTIKENNNAEVRSVLHPLQQFFQKRKIAAILIQHLRKSGDGEAQLRIMGSMRIAGVARNLWGVYIDPQDPAPKQSEKKRFLVPFPSNVCIDPTAVSFLITPPDGRIDVVDCDIETTGNDIEAALQRKKTGSGQSTEKQDVKEWLLNLLADGAKLSSEIWEAAKAERFPEKAVKQAKQELGIRSRQEWDADAKKSRWFFELHSAPEGQSATLDPEGQLPFDTTDPEGN